MKFKCLTLFPVGTDVSEHKDGGVLKSQLEAGEAFSSPNDCAACESK